MEDTTPVALFLRPPCTEAPPLLAEFSSPPLTEEASEEARLLIPPLIQS
jgi:hypothetical protein